METPEQTTKRTIIELMRDLNELQTEAMTFLQRNPGSAPKYIVEKTARILNQTRDLISGPIREIIENCNPIQVEPPNVDPPSPVEEKPKKTTRRRRKTE